MDPGSRSRAHLSTRAHRQQVQRGPGIRFLQEASGLDAAVTWTTITILEILTAAATRVKKLMDAPRQVIAPLVLACLVQKLPAATAAVAATHLRARLIHSLSLAITIVFGNDLLCWMSSKYLWFHLANMCLGFALTAILLLRYGRIALTSSSKAMMGRSFECT